MSKYDYSNIEFSVAVSNIKSSLYDVISSINGKLFVLEEDLKDNNDEQKATFKNNLESELKQLISLSDNIEKTISSVDKLLGGTVIEVNEEIEINPEEQLGNEINLDNKQIIPDQINQDEEVVLSDKAINDLYKVDETKEDNSTEDKVENEPLVDMPIDNNSESAETKETPNVENIGLKIPGLENVSEEIVSADESSVDNSVASNSVNDNLSVTKPIAEPEMTMSTPTEEKTVSESEVPTPVEEKAVSEPEAPTPVDEKAVSKPEVPTSAEEKVVLDSLPVEKTTSSDDSDIKYMVSKTSNDPSKAIIVTSSQFDKLLASHDKQRSLCKYRNLFKLGNVQHDDMNLEEMMNKANELYKSGDVKGAEELYNKISEINESRNS